MLPVDGELKPTNGSVAKMVQEYFAGDRKAGSQTSHIFETPIFDLTTRKWVG